MAPPILWEKPGGLRAATSVIETFSSNTSSHPSLLPGLPSAPPPPPTNIPRANSADPPKVPVHLLHDTLRAHPLALEGLNPACPEATLHLIMSSAGDSVNEGIRCRGGRITLERDELCPEEPALDACNDCTRDVLPSFLPPLKHQLPLHGAPLPSCSMNLSPSSSSSVPHGVVSLQAAALSILGMQHP